MGCGCGGGRRNVGSKRANTIVPRQNPIQSQPRRNQVVSGLSAGFTPNDRQELERKKRVQISLRKKNNPQG